MGKQFDYENQAWYEDTTGTYIKCGHPSAMDCGCYGKLHEGEKVTGYLESQEELDMTVTWIDIWWNSEVQIWTIQRKTREDYQVGDAGFTGHKKEAIAGARSLAEGNGDIRIWAENRTYPHAYREIK